MCFVRIAVSSAIIASSSAVALVTSPPAQAEGCTRAQFEQAVDDASMTLIKITRANKPTFQAKLRTLKKARGWTHKQFIANAVTYVQDDMIATYNATSQTALAQINTLGSDGDGTASAQELPDCSLLDQLRQHMKALVAAQQAKWAYMLKKVDTAIAEGDGTAGQN